MITISAFKMVPDFARGQVRDLRARRALEEATPPYKTHLSEPGDQDGNIALCSSKATTFRGIASVTNRFGLPWMINSEQPA